jgi:uncharacterized protein (DUF3084 family)
MLALSLLFTTVFCSLLLSACNQEEKQVAPSGTAEDYQRQLESTDQELRVTQNRMHEAEKELAVCLENIEGGRGMDERAKQLAMREAELERRENNIIENEKRADQRLNYLKAAEEEFYNKTKMTLADIGEAIQIKKEYENMRADKLAAERSRDNYLAGIFGLMVALMVFIGFLVHSRTKNRELAAKAMLIDSKKHLDR